MIRRKVQRFEVVVIGFNLRTLLDRIAEIAEHANDLVHRLDDGMFRADGTTNAVEGDVETLRDELAGGSAALNAGEHCINCQLNFGLKLVDAPSDVALSRSRRGFQPQVV